MAKARKRANRDELKMRYSPLLVRSSIRILAKILGPHRQEAERLAQSIEDPADIEKSQDHRVFWNATKSVHETMSTLHNLFIRACKERGIDSGTLDDFWAIWFEITKKHPHPFLSLCAISKHPSVTKVNSMLKPITDDLWKQASYEAERLPADTRANATKALLEALVNHHGLPLIELPDQFRTEEIGEHLIRRGLIEWRITSLDSDVEWRSLAIGEFDLVSKEFLTKASKQTDSHAPIRIKISKKGTDYLKMSERPLHGKAKECAAFIDAKPGAGGKQIIEQVGIKRSHWGNNLFPILEAHGYYNDGDGYYPPGK